MIIPDSTILLNYMFYKLIPVLDGLLVYPENMMANIEKTQGLVFSQVLLLALAEMGLSREDAYTAVQAAAMGIWNSDRQFLDSVLDSEVIVGALGKERVRACFDLNHQLRNVDAIFDRVMG